MKGDIRVVEGLDINYNVFWEGIREKSFWWFFKIIDNVFILLIFCFC